MQRDFALVPEKIWSIKTPAVFNEIKMEQLKKRKFSDLDQLFKPQ